MHEEEDWFSPTELRLEQSTPRQTVTKKSVGICGLRAQPGRLLADGLSTFSNPTAQHAPKPRQDSPCILAAAMTSPAEILDTLTR